MRAVFHVLDMILVCSPSVLVALVLSFLPRPSLRAQRRGHVPSNKSPREQCTQRHKPPPLTASAALGVTGTQPAISVLERYP